MAKKNTPTVAAYNPQCAKCNSTDLQHVKKIREMKYSGEAPNGKLYKKVVWQRYKCRECGQFQVIKRYC